MCQEVKNLKKCFKYLKIIFKTIKNTLKRADINCSDNNTMEKFRGTPAAKEKR